MNFNFAASDIALHEFGHAIGMVHEHQNPKSNPIQWNKTEVIKDLSGPPNNWNVAQIEQNVFQRYGINQTNGSSFDPNSIMIYEIPARWTTNGYSVEAPEKLSSIDKQLAAYWYPKNTQTIESAFFKNRFLRMDGRGLTIMLPGGGPVNCQFGVGPLERFVIEPQGGDIVCIRSGRYPSVYLHMDGRGITQPMPGGGGGKVRCQLGVTNWARLRVHTKSDGTVAFESVQFPNVYMRMDGHNITQFSGDGGGIVNCQFGASTWEHFRIKQSE